MARYRRSLKWDTSNAESIPVPDSRYLGMVRDWLNLPEQKGDWTLNFCHVQQKNRLFFSNKDTAFACKMRWG